MLGSPLMRLAPDRSGTRAAVAAAAVLAGLALTACPTWARSATFGLRVAPRRIGPNTVIQVSYRVGVPEHVRRMDPHHAARFVYVVRIAGPHGATASICIAHDEHDNSLPSSEDIGVRKGRAFRELFDSTPTAWCVGRWTARVIYRRQQCINDEFGTSCEPVPGRDRVVVRRGFTVRARYEASCRVSDSNTVRETTAARIYTDGSGDSLWGCLKAVGRRVHLASQVSEPDGSFSTPRLAGNFVAYAAYEGSPCARYHQCPPGYRPASYTAVVNLRTGQGHRAASTPARDRALVLTSSGAIAWISCPSRDCVSGEVRAYDSRGERVLDSGKGIDPASLRLDASTVSWTRTGMRQSAALE
jgi:hypothetical protein